MRVGIGADHAGFELKEKLAKLLVEDGREVVDFGNDVYESDDDYPDFVISLARVLANGQVERGVFVIPLARGSRMTISISSASADGPRVSRLRGSVRRNSSGRRSGVRSATAAAWPKLLNWNIRSLRLER